jgi:hypothetical protein
MKIYISYFLTEGTQQFLSAGCGQTGCRHSPIWRVYVKVQNGREKSFFFFLARGSSVVLAEAGVTL